jgi:large subunit ribosomal protein L18
MNKNKQKIIKREIRHNRVRAKIFGTANMPRLSIFRSQGHIYAQIIDDVAGKTLVSANSQKLGLKLKKSEIAKEVGKNVANLALKQNIAKVVYDRGGYKYHGRVKALAEGAREAGLKF